MVRDDVITAADARGAHGADTFQYVQGPSSVAAVAKEFMESVIGSGSTHLKPQKIRNSIKTSRSRIINDDEKVTHSRILSEIVG